MRYLCILLLLLATCPTANADHPHVIDELPETYFTVYNEQGAIILQTSLVIHTGDQLISDDNNLYEITLVDHYDAHARFIETILLTSSSSSTVMTAALTAQGPSLIAIYHTHTDESYVPSDGRSTIPTHGGILKVGDALATKLTSLGYTVEHSLTTHEPHDAGAYERSRRTVFQLLQRNPVALFDIHRDSAPISVYRTTIDNQDVSRIMIVVGRSNPLMTASYEYAKQLKAASDRIHPRLVRGIFIARGSYNQDLSPRDILIEVGTQDNSREEAERGVSLFADAIPAIISTNSGQSAPPPAQSPDTSDETTPPPSTTAQSAAGFYNILLLIGALAIGAFAYLYLSTGSLDELKNKLRQLKNIEFMHFMGRLKRRRSPKNRR